MGTVMRLAAPKAQKRVDRRKGCVCGIGGRILAEKNYQKNEMMMMMMIYYTYLQIKIKDTKDPPSRSLLTLLRHTGAQSVGVVMRSTLH